MRRSPLTSAAAVSVLACSTSAGLAQQTGDSTLSGSASLGVRSVDVSGTQAKYREDLNLDDGARLLDLSLSYAASGGDTAVDRLDLQAHNLGGDPFESIHLGVRKYGAYELKLDRRRSEYFYEDTILPAALASITGATGGDFHHFDFERIRDTAALTVNVSPSTQLSFGLERQTRTGDSTTTLDIERDEFELERPLDESLNSVELGLRHSWDKVTVIVEERLSDFENTSELFLPGASAGQNETDLAELQLFRADQSYDYRSRAHSLRVLADPTPRLNVQLAWQREDLDLDMQASEELLGTGFTGAPVTSSASGPASTGRDLEHGALDFGLALGPRLRLIGGARTSTLDQSGALLFGADQGAGVWRIETDGLELGMELAAAENLVLAAGFSTETRDTAYERELNGAAVSRRVSTERDGYFASLLYSPGGGFEVIARVEDDSIDDPFTLGSPTASTRYKLTARHRWSNGISLTANYRRTDVENDLSAWAADTEQLDLGMAYRTERLELSAGLGEVEVGRRADRLVTAGFRQDFFAIAYDAESSFRNLSARWALNERLRLGGDLRSYDNRGSFAIDRDDWRIYADFSLTASYALEASYRSIDYAEDAFDAYDAEILELAVRLAW